MTDLNYLFKRHQISLFRAANARCARSRIAHRRFAHAYAAQIASVRSLGGQ